MRQKQARERKSNSDVTRDRAAARDVIPAIVALLVVHGSLSFLDPQKEMAGWYVLWSFSPLAPALWLGWAQLRSLRRADELQRVVQLEAMAIGFGVVILLSLIGGLLDAARMGDPRQSLQVTFIVGVLAWSGSSFIMKMRAR